MQNQNKTQFANSHGEIIGNIHTCLCEDDKTTPSKLLCSITKFLDFMNR